MATDWSEIDKLDSPEEKIKRYAQEREHYRNLALGDLPKALNEVERLKKAIREHRDQKGDDRCFLDDQKLYDALGEGQPDTSLPPKEVFLANCARYHECRQNPANTYKTDNRGWISPEENQKQLKKIQILTECLERLKARAMPCGYDSGDSGVVQIIEAAERDLK